MTVWAVLHTVLVNLYQHILHDLFVTYSQYLQSEECCMNVMYFFISSAFATKNSCTSTA